MSTTPTPIYSLLPAVFRARDAAQGGPLAALFSVLEAQYGIVLENLLQLYDDQFIETCAPWVIPYLGELIGFDPVYTAALTSPDSRAEVANTIGYRRRKGTLIALEQITHDVSGRPTVAVEEFRRLITTLSLRDSRPHHAATASLRRGRDWDDPQGPFSRLNRTIDVRNIAPRAHTAVSPDTTPLEIALHGPGSANLSSVALWMWRWQTWTITNSPAFPIPGNSRGYLINPLGLPTPLFQSPAPETQPFAALTRQADVPLQITQRLLREDPTTFYPSSLQLTADGQPIDVSRIISVSLHSPLQAIIPAGQIAIDPERGQIQFAPDVTPPQDLRVTWSYGAPAPIGGGPYDRTASITAPINPTFYAVIGTPAYPTLASAVTAWNLLPQNSTGTIILPGFETQTIDLTGPNAIQIKPESTLLIAAAEVPATGAPLYTNARASLFGDIEINAPETLPGPDGPALPAGHIQINGIALSGQLRLLGSASCVQLSDSTLIPGHSFTARGEPIAPATPNITGNAIGATLTLNRVITGPIALPATCTARICNSIVDAGGPFCPAYTGPGQASPGATLHIEDSTVIGRVWAQSISLASNTIFHARLGLRDPWKAAVWAQRVQTGCVRFCWLPTGSITPRRYECLPPSAATQPALEPKFITLRFGQPGYCLLSGDTPLAIWKGADNGSQMGVYLQIQETEAVANIQIRAAEYLPANLECGLFLIPSRPIVEPPPPATRYGCPPPHHRSPCATQQEQDQTPFGIGIGLL